MASLHWLNWDIFIVLELTGVSATVLSKLLQKLRSHYCDVIMGAMASQITSLTIVYSTGADQRKHQSSASLAFVRGIHRWPVNSPHKRPVTWKMFPFDDVIMIWIANIAISIFTMAEVEPSAVVVMTMRCRSEMWDKNSKLMALIPYRNITSINPNLWALRYQNSAPEFIFAFYRFLCRICIPRWNGCKFRCHCKCYWRLLCQ